MLADKFRNQLIYELELDNLLEKQVSLWYDNFTAKADYLRAIGENSAATPEEIVQLFRERNRQGIQHKKVTNQIDGAILQYETEKASHNGLKIVKSEIGLILAEA